MSVNFSQILSPEQLIKDLDSTTPLILSIEAASNRTIRYQGQFIGVDAPYCIAIKIPHKTINNHVVSMPQVNDYVSIRFKSNHQIMGFKSQVIQLIESPAQWVIVKYPHAGYGLHIRKTQRYPSYLLASAMISPMAQVAGVIKDISVTGCSFIPLVTKHKIDLIPGSPLKLKTKLPMLKDAISLLGVVKHLPDENGSKTKSIGIEFSHPYPLIAKQLDRHLHTNAKLSLTA